jgi:Protein of unknown function (DUF2637)
VTGPTEALCGVANGQASAEARRWFVVVAAAAGILGVIGFVVSFERVSTAAWPSFGRLAPAVPVGVDLGILVFSAAGVLLAWLDMPARWLRLVPVALTGATIALNVSGERDLFGVVAHAVLPGLWVLAVAVAEHVVRHRLALDTGRRMDAVRVSRWLLAPLSTWGLWRRMVLWECRSYPDAIGRERLRLLAVAALRDTYGPLWRLRAPRRLRVTHRLGELEPAHVHAAVTPPAEQGTTDPGTAGRQTGRRTGTGSGKRTGRRTAGKAGGGRTGIRTDADLLAVLAEVPRDDDGTVPVRRAAAALGCGVDRARRLLAGQGLLRRVEPPAPTGRPVEPAAA